jgi:hypothetical protein
MKQILFLLLISGLIYFSACGAQNEQIEAQTKQQNNSKNDGKMNSGDKTPVLVELFTSEGCSSCPPADEVLARLEKEQPGTDAEIITLAFHVDYWNYLGWKDEFSSPKYSERQGGYASTFNQDSNYTPQMVVDGQKQFVGSSFDTAISAIAEAAKNTKAKVEFEQNDKNLKVRFSDLPAHEESYVWLAIAEDDLESNVKRGENSGRILRHVSVVREMNLLGNLLPEDKSFEKEIPLNFDSKWDRKNLKLVAFIQAKKSKKIYALSRKSVE